MGICIRLGDIVWAYVLMVHLIGDTVLAYVIGDIVRAYMVLCNYVMSEMHSVLWF